MSKPDTAKKVPPHALCAADMKEQIDTNALTMRLLAFSSYCEGPKASEIQTIIAQLPAAAYHERSAAEGEIQRLKQENEGLKQRLAQEVLVNRQRSVSSALAHSAPQGRTNGALDHPRTSRFDMPPSSVKQEQEQIKQEQFKHGQTSSAASSLSNRDFRLTPPHPRELFPEGSAQRPAKRLRSELSPPPPPPSTRGRRPECVGCYMIKGVCDGRSVCSICKARKYGCEYRECWDGLRCNDKACTRLHPDQWDRNFEEPPRKVKAWAEHPGAISRWE
ncbi:Hypothetical predicted protein [Lecanosticta acicola]|uniref:Uncharacterized protein n=1 Tax=Lecanosticta acicola TaxID=111012 RepID=A0AAI8YTH4_9PEZI|nr:Hypothetical predicted protein [Lecanosticta acicola]